MIRRRGHGREWHKASQTAAEQRRKLGLEPTAICRPFGGDGTFPLTGEFEEAFSSA